MTDEKLKSIKCLLSHFYKKKYIHSFDCATKSLGVCIVSYCLYPSWYYDIDIENTVNDLFRVEYIDVWNLSNKVKDSKTAANNLKKNIKKIEKFPVDFMIYENTMNANNNTLRIQNYLIFLYSEFEIIKAIPSNKNKIYFNNDLKYQNFVCKYADSHYANKVHTKENLKYYSKIYNLNISHIKNKNLDDAADAMIQAFYILFKDN